MQPEYKETCQLSRHLHGWRGWRCEYGITLHIFRLGKYTNTQGRSPGGKIQPTIHSNSNQLSKTHLAPLLHACHGSIPQRRTPATGQAMGRNRCDNCALKPGFRTNFHDRPAKRPVAVRHIGPQPIGHCSQIFCMRTQTEPTSHSSPSCVLLSCSFGFWVAQYMAGPDTVLLKIHESALLTLAQFGTTTGCRNSS